MRSSEFALDEVFRQALRRALAAQPPRLTAYAAERLIDALLNLGPDARAQAIVNGDPRLRNPRFARRLLRQSAEERFSEPRLAQSLAALAVEILELLTEEDAAPTILAHIRAEAWAALGNTQRILGGYTAAQHSFQQAETYVAEVGLDPSLESELCRFRSYLARECHRFPEALAQAERAAALASSCGDHHAAGLAWTVAAIALIRAGDAVAALPRLVEAATRLDAQAAPESAQTLFLNLARALADARQPELALTTLVRTEPLLDAAPPPIRRAATWLRGRLHGAQGNLLQAVRALEEVRGECRRLGNDYDLALATIDLCLLWANHGRSNQVNELAKTLEPLAESPRIPEVPRELIADFAARASSWKVEPAFIEETLALLRERQERHGAASSDSD